MPDHTQPGKSDMDVDCRNRFARSVQSVGSHHPLSDGQVSHSTLTSKRLSLGVVHVAVLLEGANGAMGGAVGSSGRDAVHTRDTPIPEPGALIDRRLDVALTAPPTV